MGDWWETGVACLLVCACLLEDDGKDAEDVTSALRPCKQCNFLLSASCLVHGLGLGIPCLLGCIRVHDMTATHIAASRSFDVVRVGGGGTGPSAGKSTQVISMRQGLLTTRFDFVKRSG